MDSESRETLLKESQIKCYSRITEWPSLDVHVQTSTRATVTQQTHRNSICTNIPQ